MIEVSHHGNCSWFWRHVNRVNLSDPHHIGGFLREVGSCMLDLEGLEVVFDLDIIVSPGATLDLEDLQFSSSYPARRRNESKYCNGFASEMVVLRLL